jgi:CRISPR system Cascade subunit CasA
LFAARFTLPPGARVRPVQGEALRLARSMPTPGMLVIEAPMGEGKTEAALAVAEVFAARSGAGGCYIALPTMATSNGIFPRLLSWVEKLPDDGSGKRAVFLAHAKSALQKEYAGLMGRSRGKVAAVDASYGGRAAPGGWENPAARRRPAAAEMVAHQWLRGRKKGLLSSFAVGTIDQLLMAGLKSRHLALRHLAMAGKVVVIDEVHAYDAYMNSYLDRVLSWLGAYGVPVVVLSATLPAVRRRELVAAYAGDDPACGDLTAVEDARGYPLLTAVSPGAAPVIVEAPASGRGTEVLVEAVEDDDTALADRLAAELADGGCALVVRNTVDRVQGTAAVLRERFGAGNVTVAHARYVDLDRAGKDADLLRRFGPPEPDGSAPGRPDGPHIVVASQVVEQSLDVDFDLLVTDLCPLDLLLQRMGRLHRHDRRGRPARLGTARCLVSGADWTTSPAPTPVRGSRTVYGHYPLLRSLAVLAPHLGSPSAPGTPVRLPEDISPLVQAAYGPEEPCPAAWGDLVAEARAAHEKKRETQRDKALTFQLDQVRRPGRPLIGWVEAGVGDADDTPAGKQQVRDSREGLEVLVVMGRADGSLRTLPWLGDGRGDLELPRDAVPAPHAARAAAASAMRLPYQFSFPEQFDQAVRELEETFLPAWQEKESHWLAGELILVLDEDRRARLAGYELFYDPEEGLSVTKEDADRSATGPGGDAATARSGTAVAERAGAADAASAGEDATAAVPAPAEPAPVPSFDLTRRPWLPVLFVDGSEAELSLLDVFDRARDIRRLAGDLPTQDFALFRLLLAIVHDALNGPEDIDAWEALWLSDTPFTPVAEYLEAHRERFDLLHPARPFYQVAELRTAKDEVFSLNRLVADVPNNDPFFSMRLPGVDRLSFAEAARWVVHAQAYDPSGIKSGAVGDPRVKSGKGYPQGVGWAGTLGGVMAEGGTLHESLLLNLIAADTTGIHFGGSDDRPAWRAPEPPGPAPAPDLAGRPYGLRDLYTWQSRRIRLHHDAEGVYGVVLSYGDPLEPHNRQTREPMTGWRFSAAQAKKRHEKIVYLPREHDPTRSAWRGLPGLLANQAPPKGKPGDPDAYLRPKVLGWVARLAHERYLPPTHLIRARTIGAVYGTQQSVIDEVVDDGVLMRVVLLHDGELRFGRLAVAALDLSDTAVRHLGDLAADLALAAGAEPEPRKNAARDLAYGTLDTPFRDWLTTLVPGVDAEERRVAWVAQLGRHVRGIADSLMRDGGTAEWEGRMKDRRWINDTAAELTFRTRLKKSLGTSDEVPAPRAASHIDASEVDA